LPSIRRTIIILRACIAFPRVCLNIVAHRATIVLLLLLAVVVVVVAVIDFYFFLCLIPYCISFIISLSRLSEEKLKTLVLQVSVDVLILD
jgi:hypothetical protein